MYQRYFEVSTIIPHNNFIRNSIKGVYILENKQDKDKLIEIFERYNAKYCVGKIKFLTENDQQFIHD